MFIGHYAVGLASKRLVPERSLVLLLTAPMLLDLLWPIFLLLGVERVALDPGAPTPFLMLRLEHMPWSHSLVMAVVWSVALGVVTRLTGNGKGAVVVGLAVFSHWVLDLLTHRPDMPLLPTGGEKVGLGLWNSVAATVTVELLMFAGAVFVYLRTTRARGVWGHVSFWSLTVLLGGIYVGLIFGPPPPNVEALRYSAMASWILVPWAWWIERTRLLVANP